VEDRVSKNDRYGAIFCPAYERNFPVFATSSVGQAAFQMSPGIIFKNHNGISDRWLSRSNSQLDFFNIFLPVAMISSGG